MRVLIVEDEPLLADAIQRGLRIEAIAADVARDGARAMEAVAETRYDVVVLDRDIPVVHGDDVCRRITRMDDAPKVLMLTASAAVSERVAGLAIGADDYLTKPFDFDELVARIAALYRRSGVAVPPVLDVGDLRVDSFRREAYREGRFLHLTRKEFAVLEVLVRAAGGVVSAEDLLEQAWDENADPFTNTIRVTVSTLRKKMGAPALVETVPGAGYRIVRPSSGEPTP
ncbi:response regulator transcription factor [Microbacterium sp. RG1]|uniref:response regulator transcription factor n=1 Tax=Microbacterium sp. RG1 TaxID=2489212 RepID=UPI0010CA60E3|nr:response regulator transcription factor [Microbacterium sp. RG1]QCQ17169.1 response regulator transcription factor [Microbacterium sp. RG1]